MDRRWNATTAVAGTLMSIVLTTMATAQVNWQFAGPDDCAATNGACAGRMLAVKQNPLNANMVFAGHASGGLWKSVDAGQSWTCVLDGPIGSIAYRSPKLGPVGRLIVGTGEYLAYNPKVPGDGIWVSNDDGGSWTHALSWTRQERRSVGTLAIDVAGNVVYAGTNQGLYVSSTGGATWSATPVSFFQDREIVDVAAHPSVSGLALATVEDAIGTGPVAGIYRTDDYGATWSRVSLDTPATTWPAVADWGRAVVAWSPVNTERVYARIAEPAGAGNGILRIMMSETATPAQSGSLGSWFEVWSNAGCGGGNLCGVDRAADCLAFDVVESDGEDYLVCGGLSAYRSLDRGFTWEHLPKRSSAGYHSDVHGLDPVDGGYWLATDGGIYFHEAERTDLVDDLVMEQRNNDLYSLQFYEISSDQSQNPSTENMIVGATQDQGVWLRADEHPGQHPDDWFRPLGQDGFRTAAGGACLTGCVDAGSTVFYATNGPPMTLNGLCEEGEWFDQLPSSAGTGPILVDPLGTEVVYVFKIRTLRKVTCEQVFDMSSVPSGHGSVLSAEMVASGGQRRAYAGTTRGNVFRFDEQLGGLWLVTEVSPASPPWGSYVSISSVAVDAGAGAASDAVFVTLRPNDSDWSLGYTPPGGVVWKLENGAWSAAASGLPAEPAYRVLVNPAEPDQLIVGTLTGIHYSSDRGDSWCTATQGLPEVVVHDLDYQLGSGILFAGTHGRSIWQDIPANWPTCGNGVGLGLRGTGEPLQPALASAQESLRGVGNRVALTLAESANVEIAMYDVGGRHVGDVASKRLGAGRHEFAIDESLLDAGVYFARVSVDGYRIGAIKVVRR